MLALWIEELARVGLEIHDDKTKMITSGLQNSIDSANISGKMIEVLDCNRYHKYRGKFINETSIRSTFELQHRTKAAWHAFHEHRRWLLNTFILTQLDFVFSPMLLLLVLCLAISTISLNRLHLDRHCSFQLKLFRQIVEWVRIDSEECETLMHRMKQHMSNASR